MHLLLSSIENLPGQGPTGHTQTYAYGPPLSVKISFLFHNACRTCRPLPTAVPGLRLGWDMFVLVYSMRWLGKGSKKKTEESVTSSDLRWALVHITCPACRGTSWSWARMSSAPPCCPGSWGQRAGGSSRSTPTGAGWRGGQFRQLLYKHLPRPQVPSIPLALYSVGAPHGSPHLLGRCRLASQWLEEEGRPRGDPTANTGLN